MTDELFLKQKYDNLSNKAKPALAYLCKPTINTR